MAAKQCVVPQVMKWAVVAPAARTAICDVGVGVNTACRVQYQESNVAPGYGVG